MEQETANQLTTSRLILRPWRESDAEALHKYVKAPAIQVRILPVISDKKHYLPLFAYRGRFFLKEL